MRGDAVRLLEEDEFRDVLVPVMGVEEVVLPVLLEDKRACRHRLRRIPAEDEVYGIIVSTIQTLYADVAIIYEAMMGVRDGVYSLNIFDTPPHAVELHSDIRAAALPQDGAVLGVVGNLPDACRGLYQSLVAVVVELGEEFLPQRRGVAEIGDLGVLVEAVSRVGMIGAKVQRGSAVANVVVLVGVFRQVRGRRVLRSGHEFASVVVAVVVRPRLAHHRARAGYRGAPSRRVVHVVVLRDDPAVDVVPNLRQKVAALLVGVVRGSRAAVLEAAL